MTSDTDPLLKRVDTLELLVLEADARLRSLVKSVALLAEHKAAMRKRLDALEKASLLSSRPPAP